MQRNTVTKKNSESRNLFRLLNGVLFIARMLQNLVKDKSCLLRTACNDAYSEVLASMHSYLVRTAVRGSMYMLPSREQFLASIKETGGQWPQAIPACLCLRPVVLADRSAACVCKHACVCLLYIRAGTEWVHCAMQRSQRQRMHTSCALQWRSWFRRQASCLRAPACRPQTQSGCQQQHPLDAEPLQEMI